MNRIFRERKMKMFLHVAVAMLFMAVSFGPAAPVAQAQPVPPQSLVVRSQHDLHASAADELRASATHDPFAGAADADLTELRRRTSSRLIGAGIGFVAGAGITWVVLHSGGSTSRCDRSANQDALNSRECIGLTVLGGLAGAGIGAIVGGMIGPSRMQHVPLDRLRVGWVPGDGRRAVVTLVW
jgi:hypothetical protein